MTFTLTRVADSARHAVEVRKLAIAFSRGLRDDVGPQNLETIKTRNAAEQDAGVCHSHDFCDPNVTMFECMVEVVGRKRAKTACDGLDAEQALWNDAWSLAKRLQFDTDLIATVPL